MKRNLKTRLISILAVACMLIGIVPAMAEDANTITITATDKNWDSGHNFHPAYSGCFVMQMSEAAIKSAEKPWVEYVVYAENAGLYDIEFKTTKLADGGYTSPATFSVNGKNISANVNKNVDANTNIYTTSARLNAGENTVRFTITGPRPNTGTDGLFHIFYINCTKKDDSVLRYEGEGSTAKVSGGWQNAPDFKHNQVKDKESITAGKEYWEQSVPAAEGLYKLTWRSTLLAGTQYVSPVTLTVNGEEVKVESAKLNTDPFYLQTANVYLNDGVNKIRFTIADTKNFGADNQALLYLDYIELEYLSSGNYKEALKYDDIGGNSSGSQYYGGKSYQMFIDLNNSYTLDIPAGTYDLYVGACSSIWTDYLGTLSFKLDSGEFTDFTTSNTSEKVAFSDIGGHFKYNETLTLTGKEKITFKCTASAIMGSNNYVLYDYFELVPQDVEIGEAVLTVGSNKMACGTTMQAGAKLYYENGYECSERVIESVSYESTNPSVATVDEDGVITAVNPGVAEITVTYNDEYTASAKISVYDESGIIPVSSSYNAETGKTTIKLTRVIDTEGLATVILGAYNEEDGVRTSFSDIKLAKDLNPVRGRVLTVTETITGDNVCAFVWDSLEGLKPLMDAIELK